MAPAVGHGDPAAIEAAADLLAGAKNPLVIAQRGAGDAASFAAFGKWAEDWGIAVCSYWATHLAIDTDHPCHVGADPGPWMAEADVVVILDCLAPWWPDKHHLKLGAKVINIGPDPIFSRFPVRNFPSDVSIAGENRLAVPALIAAMEGKARDEAAIAARREDLAAASSKEREALGQRIEETYRQAFPKANRVVNPRVQMQQQLDQLLRRQGGGDGFMTLLARAGDVLRTNKAIEISGASFRAGRLDVDLTANNLQVLDELKQTLAGKGLVVEIQSATTDASQRVKSRLRIQGGSA